MSQPIKPISVKDLLHKAATGPVGPVGNAPLEQPKLKVLSIRGSEPVVASNWIHDEVMEAFGKVHGGEMEVANYDLTKMRISPCNGCYGGGGRSCILPCDRNDIDSDIYDPRDEMIKIYASIKSCDLLLLSTDFRNGQLPSYTSKFVERLKPFRTMAGNSRPVINRQVFGLIAVGSSNAGMGDVLATFNGLGFTVPPRALIDWTTPSDDSADQIKSAYKKDVPFHQRLQAAATGLSLAATTAAAH